MTCIICGKEFVRKQWKENTCSLICRKERNKRLIKLHQQNNPIIYRKSAKKYYESHKEEIAKYKRERNELFKTQVLEHYGPICACCGETHKEFLTVDHVNGEGYIHRKNTKLPRSSEWLARNNFPEGFQILCMNCNYLKGNEKVKFCKVHHPELYEIHS